MLGPIGPAGRSWQFAGLLGLRCRFAATDSKEQHRLEQPSAREKIVARGSWFVARKSLPSYSNRLCSNLATGRTRLPL